MPYRKKAEEKAPNRKYFNEASWLRSRLRRAIPHNKYSGRLSTSRATNMVMRSLDAANSIIPATANMASGNISLCSTRAATASASPADPGGSPARPVNALRPPSRVRSANNMIDSNPKISNRPQVRMAGPSNANDPSPPIWPCAARSPSTEDRCMPTQTVSMAAAIDTVWVGMHLSSVDGDLAAHGQIGGEGSLAFDGPAILTWGLLLIFGLLSIMLFAERTLDGGLSAFTGRAGDPPGSAGEAEAVAARVEHSEIFPLAMFAVAGMMLFAASNDLITMFVALEVLSLPLYLLCGMARRRRLLSQEASLKYFLLGAFSSAFFLYGIALTYGYAGSFVLSDINNAVTGQIGSQVLLLSGMGLILVGALFRIGAAPFHPSTPDAYHSAPTAVTAFMAAGTKTAAMVALLRVFFVGCGGAEWDGRPINWAVALLTMSRCLLLVFAQP